MKRRLHIILFSATVAIIVAIVLGCNGCNAPSSQADIIEAMKNRLTPEESRMLQSIYEPTVVGVPPADARVSICVMPDGEIRAYGRLYRTEENPNGEEVYLSSLDCGLTWKKHYTSGKMQSASYIPEMKLWVKSPSHDTGGPETVVYTSKTGPEDPDPTIIKVTDSSFFCQFLPQKSRFSDRVFFTAQMSDSERDNPAGFFYSDDGCKSFKYTLVYQTAQHEVAYPHKDVRWRVGCGTEPFVCELTENRMMMLLRNSTDCFYQAFSADGGTTWSTPEPSPFNGTDTTPFILRLTDGRILTFWNNTRPLPEVEHASQINASDWVISGKGEDYFTNRDANHVAISEDDGATWIHSRELYLNDIRNNADFRYIGGPMSSNDKSVHQFQAIELPFNKVLVTFGQNEVARKIVIFDVDWLYEKNRSEDFFSGLRNVSTQVYLKSVSGHTKRNGHCSYNRTNGAIKAIDPTGGNWEVVQISRIDDPRLVSPVQGLVWNFPASVKGRVDAEIYLAQDAADISLSDCWYNPCDQYVPELAQCSFHIDKSKLSMREFHRMSFCYDLTAGEVRMYVDDKLKETKPLRTSYNIGLCYIIIQCNAPAKSEGLYLRRLDATGQ